MHRAGKTSGLAAADSARQGAHQEQQARRERCKQLLGLEVSSAEWPPFDLARAYELYQALFAPFAEVTKGKHLIIVPSGPLTSLPFQVLVTEKPDPALTGMARYAGGVAGAAAARHGAAFGGQPAGLAQARPLAGGRALHRLRQSAAPGSERQRQARLGQAELCSRNLAMRVAEREA